MYIVQCAVLCSTNLHRKNWNSNAVNGRIKTDAVDSEFPFNIKVEVKVKVKVNFTLEQATKGQRGSRGTALLFLQLRR